jgi:hypothetical protein
MKLIYPAPPVQPLTPPLISKPKFLHTVSSQHHPACYPSLRCNILISNLIYFRPIYTHTCRIQRRHKTYRNTRFSYISRIHFCGLCVCVCVCACAILISFCRFHTCALFYGYQSIKGLIWVVVAWNKNMIIQGVSFKSEHRSYQIMSR